MLIVTYVFENARVPGDREGLGRHKAEKGLGRIRERREKGLKGQRSG
jgi:hypothetical protein